jgi:DNA-binding response OmpR family regulator
MARSKSIDLHVECAEALPAVEADADRMSQVLSNLVSNALKYTQSGGTVQLSARANADEVLICVADNGPGIPRDQWDQIFDRFSQISVSFVREISGVGLGLFIVRQIVTRHGGRVWVDSEVGKGSAFYVALPRTADLEAAREQETEVPTAGRVVVCDTDPELANRMAHKLRRQHYDVRTAYSGCRLLAQIVETPPDVVVTDVLLPDMNSADVLASLRDLRARHDFKLVVHTYVGEGLEMRRHGADVVLSRPAQMQELEQAVDVAIKKKRPSGLAVLLFCGARVDGTRLCRLLTDSGHIALTTETKEEAAQLARNYPIDVVVLAEESLDSEWSAAAEILGDGQRHPRVVVLVRRIGRSQRRIAAERGAAVLVYERGGEAELIAEVTARPDRPAEEAAR